MRVLLPQSWSNIDGKVRKANRLIEDGVLEVGTEAMPTLIAKAT